MGRGIIKWQFSEFIGELPFFLSITLTCLHRLKVTVQPFATGRLHLSNIFSSRERLRLVASVTVLSSKEPR